jgi:molybdate transport system regulatory protein
MPQRPSKATSRPPAPPKLRGKLWVESDGSAALTEAGADLLEQIAACGSLSEAARRLRFSYRRAWLLTDAMNKRWSGPLVVTATGGKHGGGTRVTELGAAVLRAYRDLQVQLEALLDQNAEAFRRATTG